MIHNQTQACGRLPAAWSVRTGTAHLHVEEKTHCAAIVDRLTFNAIIIETSTESYRLARARAGAAKPAA
jgi:hypothetical protein